MKVIFLGTPSFAVPTLEMLNKYYEVVLVVTKKDARGNHNKIIYSPVKEKALELGLQLFQPERLKDDYKPLLETGAHMLVTAAYGEFIPSVVLKEFKYKLNVHGSLLPKRRGGAPIQRALMEGDTYTGVTIMEMAKKMDAGKIYSQRRLEILPSDNSTTLFQKLSIIGRDLLKETLPSIIAGTNQGVKQNEEEATFSYVLTKADEIIDFNKTSIDLFNQIRALALEPGAYFKFKDQPYKILASKVVETNKDALPGTILSLNKEFVIKTKDKALSILKIKPAGKKTMDVLSFLNGQRIFKEQDIITCGDKLV